MIIHISQTSQSYLVPEKKTIIFLKHAGVTKADIDMNIQLPLSGCAKPALAETRPDEGSAAPQRFVAWEQHVIITRDHVSSANASSKQWRKVDGVDNLNFGRVDH